MNYIEWDKQKLEEYLADKFKRRGVNIEEYLFLTEFIKSVNPSTIIDVGCFYGVSTYILGTSSKDIEYLIGIDNPYSENFVPYVREDKPIPQSEYGKFIPEGGTFIGTGYEKNLPDLLKHHNDVFVFLDSVKLADRVFDELKVCHEGKARWVGVHDTCKRYKHPRRAVKHAIELGWYKLIGETCIEEIPDIKVKGVTILEGV